MMIGEMGGAVDVEIRLGVSRPRLPRVELIV